MPPSIVFDHLDALTTPLGLFEHAEYALPRPDHGFCLDDVARALVVTSREPHPSASVMALSEIYLAFVLAAQSDDGRFRNRRSVDGTWVGEPSLEDHWGRAVWALGVVATGDHVDHRGPAREALGRAIVHRSPWPHATAYASLGAAAVFAQEPMDAEISDFLVDARARLPAPSRDPFWPWPELSLTYANALFPEALIAVGVALKDRQTRDSGLSLLSWLWEVETTDGQLSVVPVGGWRRGQSRPGFDQQPIEVSALAEACLRAYHVGGDTHWAAAVDVCAAWFNGVNDSAGRLYDPATGAGFDGLQRRGVNANQGAESTIAALATMQCVAALEGIDR